MTDCEQSMSVFEKEPQKTVVIKPGTQQVHDLAHVFDVSLWAQQRPSKIQIMAVWITDVFSHMTQMSERTLEGKEVDVTAILDRKL